MPYHTAAFWENIDPAGVLSNLAAAAGEQALFTTGDDIRIPSFASQLALICAQVASGGTGRAELQSPSLRRFVNLNVQPVNGVNDGNVEPASPALFYDLHENPIALDPDESLNALVDSNPTAAADQSVIVFLADGPIAPVSGPAHSVRATGAITAVAGQWTSGALTFAQTLPAGEYDVVGMWVRGDTIVAARLIFVGQANRPGVIGGDVDNDEPSPLFRHGRFGVLGHFDSTTPPQLEVLCNDADTAQEVVLDLVKTA